MNSFEAIAGALEIQKLKQNNTELQQILDEIIEAIYMLSEKFDKED
jgi:hypothetical protein